MDRYCLICGEKFSVESEKDPARVCANCVIEKTDIHGRSRRIIIRSLSAGKRPDPDGKWIEKFFDAIEGRTGPIRW